MNGLKEIKTLLEEFRGDAAALAGGEYTLGRLKILATKKIEFKNRKSYKSRRTIASNKNKRRAHFSRPCIVCHASPPSIRHHIITIWNGGDNRKINIVPVCNSCHAKIHPWLAR